MISAFTFTQETTLRCPHLEQNPALTFAPGINLLLGSNGSGKSTILNAIRDGKGSAVKDMGQVIHFSSESIKSVQSVFGGRSHGESMRDQLVGLANIVPGSTVLLDEPDLALSIDGVVELCKIISTKSKEGVQFIISSHNVLVWTLSWANIIPLTHPTWHKKHLALLKKRLP